MTSHPPSSSPVQSNVKLDYNYLVLWVPLIVIIVLFAIAIAMGCCDWLRYQFLSVRDMLNHGHNVNMEMQSWIRAFKYQKNEPDVEGHEGEATPECPICISPFDEGEEISQLPSCGHSFHAACIVIWLNSHNSCPICRGSVLPIMS
ncbi:hypothetical protein M5K25_013241 [Dendrobium thyrsiflorum]|uniref:RING-type domain-containing protein n=1 Tax=Dendrobium thyrsiflorum TaxID=117978 RepID=A0ABD0UTA7_DENTH